jgi:hypothetical protein
MQVLLATSCDGLLLLSFFVKCNGTACGTFSVESARLEELSCRVVEETDHSVLDHCLVRGEQLRQFKSENGIQDTVFFNGT